MTPGAPSQPFGLRFGEDLTAVSETSDRAKPERCTQFGETASAIDLQTRGGPPSSYSQQGPRQWQWNWADLTGRPNRAHHVPGKQTNKKIKSLMLQCLGDLSALKGNNQTEQTQLSDDAKE